MMSDGNANEMNPAPEELDQAAAVFAEATSGGISGQMAELQAKVDDLQSRLMRSYADLENFRRRVQRDQDDARKYESLRLVRDLLPGLDGLNRAISSGEQTGDKQVLLDGLRMVAQQFRDILRVHAAEPIESVGRPFDPNLHEALTQIPSADHEPMTVLQEIEMGYRMHDRVVRPARVIVSCAPLQT